MEQGDDAADDWRNLLDGNHHDEYSDEEYAKKVFMNGKEVIILHPRFQDDCKEQKKLILEKRTASEQTLSEENEQYDDTTNDKEKKGQR